MVSAVVAILCRARALRSGIVKHVSGKILRENHSTLEIKSRMIGCFYYYSRVDRRRMGSVPCALCQISKASKSFRTTNGCRSDPSKSGYHTFKAQNSYMVQLSRYSGLRATQLWSGLPVYDVYTLEGDCGAPDQEAMRRLANQLDGTNRDVCSQRLAQMSMRVVGRSACASTMYFDNLSPRQGR